MKVRIAEAPGSPIPQFVISAENETERMVLARFASYAYKPEYVFRFSGAIYEVDYPGVAAFNFGLYKSDGTMEPREKEIMKSKVIEEFSFEELQAELDRRNRAKREAEKPRQLDMIDVSPIAVLCQNYIDTLETRRYVDEGLERYIFEAAMEAVFGKDVWGWISRRL